MKRTLIVYSVLSGFALSCEMETIFAQQTESVACQKRLLRPSIVGSASCEGKQLCYIEVMKNIAVQRFLLDLAKGPIELHAADAAMKNAAVSIEDLLTLRLIRREGNRYFLNFALFTAADIKRIRETSEHYAASLAKAILARRKEIEQIIRAYDAPGVDPKAVVYFLIGCASLDWDGLVLTADKGYRKTTEERPDGNYVPVAEEITTEELLKKIYWGSHTTRYDGVNLTSFGDHYSVPRYMLPDLLWRTRDLTSSYPEPVKVVMQELMAESLQRVGYQLGQMMLALRDGQKSSTDLERVAGVKESEAKSLLHLLIALDYVVEQDGLYSAQIPVLTKRDEAMARKILAVSNQVMEQWLAKNYESIKAHLKDLSFMRSGVPFSEGFTMIWHYLFGITNRRLVEAGLFADPYETTRKYKGAIPVVDELELGSGTRR